MKLTTLLVTSSLVLLLSACSSSDSGSDDSPTVTTGETPVATTSETPDATTAGATARIAGLWDDTTDEGPFGIDVNYVLFNGDGTGTGYDFQGDSLDQGENCYLINELILEDLGNDRYRTGIVGDVVPPLTITANVIDGNLVIVEFGETRTLPPLIGLSPTDFNEC